MKFSLNYLPSWFSATFFLVLSTSVLTAQQKALEPLDVFKLAYISDPVISPDGAQVAYVRNGYDIMTDRRNADLWLAAFDGSEIRPLATGEASDQSPVWAPDGKRLAWVSGADGKHSIMMRWMESGEQSAIAELQHSPSNLSWSPDGNWLAFTQFVPGQGPSLVDMPGKPEGAEWAPAPNYTEELVFRRDGQGELKPGHTHIFLLPAEGGSAVQLSSGPYDHGSNLSWSADSKTIYFSANRRIEPFDQPRNSEIYSISVEDGTIKQLTDRMGMDASPKISPDGNRIAWLGFDDERKGYQQVEVHVSELNEMAAPKVLTTSLDRSVGQLQWSPDGEHLWFVYDDQGHTKAGRVSLNGKVEEVVSGLAGGPVGRPYSGGDMAVGPQGRYAVTMGDASRPADLATGNVGSGEPRKLTDLNKALFLQKKPGKVEEFWTESSFDGRRIQGWIMYPPDFDASKKYPLLLEIHGGPYAAYGDYFSMELQQYAARGYVVVYTNPRGSTSYGEEFADLIHHNYPGNDYDDLMSSVDAVIDKGFIDTDHLYVTGGSGGGVLSAWIVGKTDRFRAAVVAKPVINWFSHVLTADAPAYWSQYWFPAKPWEDPDHYYEHSPISLVGNVKTPTMLLVGDVDYRTPLSESEQFYRALKLRGVETALIRFPGASHGIAGRPSQMLAKARAVMGWMAKHGGPKEEKAQP